MVDLTTFGREMSGQIAKLPSCQGTKMYYVLLSLNCRLFVCREVAIFSTGFRCMVQCRSLGGLDYMPDDLLALATVMLCTEYNATFTQYTRPSITVTTGSTAYNKGLGLFFSGVSPYFGGAVLFGIVTAPWRAHVAL